jgi:hypothetical protein
MVVSGVLLLCGVVVVRGRAVAREVRSVMVVVVVRRMMVEWENLCGELYCNLQELEYV